MTEPVVGSQPLYLDQHIPTFFHVSFSSYPALDTSFEAAFASSDPLKSLADLCQPFTNYFDFAAPYTDYWALLSTNWMPTEDQIFG